MASNSLKNDSKILLLGILCFSILFTTGCMTTAKEKELRRDIFNLQTRLLTLEQVAKSRGFDTDAANQRIASTATMLEKLTRDSQKVAGEIDALKVGVKTGRLPGADPSEPSVETTLSGVISRLEEVEEAQAELLQAISSIAESGKVKRKGSTLRSLKDVQTAFAAKKFLHITQDVSNIIGKTKDKAAKSSLVYYQAESLYKLGKLQEAALKFNDYLEGKPKKNLIAHSKMRMGDCFRHLGEMTTARLYYTELVDEFPKTTEAEKARQRLKELDRKGASVHKRKRTKHVRAKKGARTQRGG